MTGSRVLRIAERAEDDLAEIWAFIAADSPGVASAFVHKLDEHRIPLLSYPELGPARETIALGVRVRFYRDYVIYCRFNDEEVIIVRVAHGSRDARALIGDR